MIKLSFRSLLAHKGRTAMAVLAVVLGAGFVSGTFVFNDALSRVLTSAVEGSATDLYITPKAAVSQSSNSGVSDDGLTLTQADVTKVAGVAGVERAAGEVNVLGAFLLNDAGKVAASSTDPSYGYAWTGLGSTSATTLAEGRAPVGLTEVVLDRVTAEKASVAVGDSVSVLLPSGNKIKVIVTGLYNPPGAELGSGTSVVFAPSAAQSLLMKPGEWSAVAVALRPGSDASAVKQQITTALGSGVEVTTRTEQIDQAKELLSTVVNVFTYVLLGFALVSLLVGAFLIVNTFTMVVAQRTREMALLRAIGARRRQVTRSLMLEALLIGVVGAVVGMVLGLGIAVALAALLRTTGLDLSFTPRLTPAAVGSALGVGILVTLLAAYVPTRRAGRIAPVEALRESTAATERPRRRRTVFGLVAALLTAGAFTLSATAGDVGPKALWTGVGALLLIATAVVLAPLLATALVGVLPRSRRAPTRLARANTVRNPRRTAATAAALMVGLAVVTGVSVVASSITASIGNVVDDKDVHIDYAVSGNFAYVTPAVQKKIQAVPGVDVALAQQSFSAQAGTANVEATANAGAQLTSVFAVQATAGTVNDIPVGSFLVDDKTAKDNGWQVGEQVPFTFVTGQKKTLRLSGIYTSTTLTSGVQVNQKDYLAATKDANAGTVYIKGATGTDLKALRTALESVTADNPLLIVQTTDDVKAQASSQVNTLLSIVYGLLVLSIIIAVLGVINTMAMSVLERTREIGLLRAVGLTRRQSRSMIRRESMLIALLGAILGVSAGLVIGVFLQRALAGNGIDQLAVPWTSLAVFMILAAVIGVVAALAPARRASRMDVLEAIATS